MADMVTPPAHASMLLTLQRAVHLKCDPKSVFSAIICLGWYDGPLSGLLTCNNCDFRYELVDEADVLRFRVYELSPLPNGSVPRFMAAMREFGQLAHDELPPSPMWVPMWRFPTTRDQQAAEQFTDDLLATSGDPLATFCWDFDEAQIIACRGIDDPQARPSDWFGWLGIQRDGGRIAPRSNHDPRAFSLENGDPLRL